MIAHNFSILNEVFIMVDKYKNITNKTCSLSVKWVLDEIGTHAFIDFLINGKSIFLLPLNASLFELHARLEELLLVADRRGNQMIDDEVRRGWAWNTDWNRPVWVELERINFERYQVTCIPYDVDGERWVVHPHEFFETELQCAIYQKMMLLREINRIDAYIERGGNSND